MLTRNDNLPSFCFLFRLSFLFLMFYFNYYPPSHLKFCVCHCFQSGAFMTFTLRNVNISRAFFQVSQKSVFKIYPLKHAFLFYRTSSALHMFGGFTSFVCFTCAFHITLLVYVLYVCPN